MGQAPEHAKARTMTPAMELKNTEYADRYEVNVAPSLRRFHGHMARPMIAATKPPRRIF